MALHRSSNEEYVERRAPLGKCGHKENTMNEPNDLCRLGEGSFVLDPEASMDMLLDDAGEWLAYAEGLNEVLAETFADNDLPNRRHLIRLLGAATLMTYMGAQCVRQAKVRHIWDAQAMLGGD